MGPTAAPPPRFEGGKRGRERSGLLGKVVPVTMEPIEDGEIVREAGMGKVDAAGKGSQEIGFRVQSRAFWQVKTAENRAAGAGMQLKFHQGLVAADEICVSEEIWSRAAVNWMFTLVGWIFGAAPPLGKLKRFVRAKMGR
ncbi:hypothetical protein QQ045_009905 [Rhodiola kirilowii]